MSSRRLAPLERQLAPQTLAIFAIAALVAIVGPLLSYRSDVAELREQAHERVQRDARLFADALAHHLSVLEAELVRLAERPEVDLADQHVGPERALLEVSHRGSAIFVHGVAFIDADGHLVWSEPSPMRDLGETSVDSGWFQDVLKTGRPSYGFLSTERKGGLAIAVPIMRDKHLTGAIVGVVGDFQTALPQLEALGKTRVAVIDRHNWLVAIGDAAAWGATPALAARLRAIPDASRRELALDHDQFVAAAHVGGTGLDLALLAHEDPLLAPFRARFILQFVTISAVQLAAVLMLAALMRYVHRRFLDLETKAMRQERLADLGRASSLIAHEIKNSLNSINAAVSLLGGAGDGASPAGVLRAQVDRLRHLGTSLLQFAKPAAPHPTPTALAPLVADTVDGLKTALPESADVTVTRQLDEEVSAACDPVLLGTALDNLVRNAIEAAATAHDTGRTTTPLVHVTLRREGPRAIITVEDNAGGLPASMEGKLFEPFATSKPKGIGLGLSMARRAVEDQGGQLRLEPGENGLRFVIELILQTESQAQTQ